MYCLVYSEGKLKPLTFGRKTNYITEIMWQTHIIGISNEFIQNCFFDFQ